MIVRTVWQGKRAFVATGDSGHPIAMDAAAAYGGEGSGATPMELLLAGLAGCIGIDVTMILDKYLGDIRRLEIETAGVRKETPPKGFTAIEVTFRVDGDIPDYRIRKAIEMGLEKYCSVADSLKADIRYRLILNGAEAGAGG
jgi:putative redox protein